MPGPGHARLDALVARARTAAAATASAAPGGRGLPALGLVYPCDALALDAAARIGDSGIAQVVLIGPRQRIERAAATAGMSCEGFEIVDTADAADGPAVAARRATALVREGSLAALMKGSLHTDELMAAIVDKATGLRTDARISHAFLFDLPRYPKLLGLTDCVVNISPTLETKRAILGHGVALLKNLGIAAPKVGILAAVETVNPAITATVDAAALVQMAGEGAWPGALVEGPLGFDNAISAAAARAKGIESRVAGDADLLLVPDLNAGNMLYKSFVYIGGGECAGLVLGARVPVVLTSRADSVVSRIASVALAVLVAQAQSGSGKPR